MTDLTEALGELAVALGSIDGKGSSERELLREIFAAQRSEAVEE